MPLTFNNEDANNTNDDTNDNNSDSASISNPNKFTNDNTISYANPSDTKSKKLIFETGQILCDDSNIFGDLGKLIDEQVVIDKNGRSGGTFQISRQRKRTDPVSGQFENTISTKSVPFFIGEGEGGFECGIIKDSELGENSPAYEHVGFQINEPNWSRISNAGGTVITNNTRDTGINLSADPVGGDVLTIQRLFQSNEVPPKMHGLIVEGCVDIISNPTVINGAPRSANSYQTTFRNPITIHKNKHYLSFHLGEASMEEYNPIQENSFSVDCESTFSRDITLQQTADLDFPISTLLSGSGDPIFNTKYTNEIQDYTTLNVKVNATVNPFGAATNNNLTFQGYISKLVKDLTVPEEQQQFSPTTFPASGTEIMFTLPNDYCPHYRIVFTNISSFTDLSTNPPTQGPNATVIVEASGSVIFDANETVLANNNNAHNIVALNFNPSLVYYNNIEPPVYSLYKSGVSISTSIQPTSTVLFDENSTWNNTSSTLPIGVYIVYIEQSGGTPDGTSPNNDLWQLAARFPLIIHTATTNDTNGPAQELQGVVFTHANNHNGDIRFYFEHGNATTTPRTPWKVHMIFSQVNSTNDTANFNIKLKKENW